MALGASGEYFLESQARCKNFMSLPPPPCSVPLSLRAPLSAAAPVTAVVASGDHKTPSAALATPRGRALLVHPSMPPLVVEFERAVQGRAVAPLMTSSDVICSFN